MPVYKLHYFEARGRAEPARLCFAAADVKYEDIRYTGEQWQEKKKEGLSPLGYLPMLEVDGKKLCESMAILRYVARECGLCPSDSFQNAQCDMINDTVNDLIYKKMGAFIFEKDEEKKKSLKNEFFGTELPNYLTKMTALLKENSGGQGFFVGDKLTYADISMYTLGDFMARLGDKTFDKFPEIKAHHERVCEISGIKDWIKKRPETKM